MPNIKLTLDARGKSMMRGPGWLAVAVLLFELYCVVRASQLVFPSDFPDDVRAADSPGPRLTDTFDDGQISLSTTWSVLGPFPAGMREHQTGAFPALAMHPLSKLFNLSHPIHLPSAYGKEGAVTVRTFEASDPRKTLEDLEDHSWACQELRLSYDDLDWSSVRQSVGWAGIQWQALSVSDLDVVANGTVSLSVAISSVAEFTILGEEEYDKHSWWRESGYDDDDEDSATTTWYNGDMYGYNLEGMAKHDQVPAHLLHVDPGRHKLILKSVYEVRIFGDDMSKAPEAKIHVDMRVVGACLSAIVNGQDAVVPDVVGGVFAGWGLSFALHNAVKDWIEIVQISLEGVESSQYLALESVDPGYRIAPLQVRPIRVRVIQTGLLPDTVTTLPIRVNYRYLYDRLNTHTLHTKLRIEHVKITHTKSEGKKSSEPASYLFTFLDSDSTVQYAAAVPPRKIEAGGAHASRPAILYLHGAGVDIKQKHAQQAFLQQEESWVIHPSGRSAWGLDWQTNLSSPLSALESFAMNLYGLTEAARMTAAQIDTKKIMIAGHSNGGQGVLYFTSKHPDLILGAVIGAPYLSLSNYVPLTWQQGRHFNDAAMAGILLSSLSLFDNSLYLCNLAGLPIMLKYGSEDDNVPTWHSKETHSLLRMWNHASRAPDGLLKLSEVPNRGHYWPDFMREADVQVELDEKLRLGNNATYQMPVPLCRFSLHVFNPEDSGSKQGWRITQVEIPGRMARLDVEYTDSSNEIKVRSSHVVEIELRLEEEARAFKKGRALITIDGSPIGLDRVQSGDELLVFRKTAEGWSHIKERGQSVARPQGPMIRFLSSSGPIRLILPTHCSEDLTEQFMSIARRFATDAYLYSQIDCKIEYDDDFLPQLEQLDSSNVLLLGGPHINSATRLTVASQTLIKFINGSAQFSLRDRTFSQDTTLLSMVPHVFSGTTTDATGKGMQHMPMALLLHGTDSSSIERGYSLLPVRTGTLLPEWIVMDKSSMCKGYGGVVASGWFDHHWGWSESMSYLE